MRLTPGYGGRRLTPQRAVRAGIEIKPSASHPGFDIVQDGAVEAWLARCLDRGDTSAKVELSAKTGIFAGAEVAMIVCGFGDISDVHRPTKAIPINPLQQLNEVLDGAVHDLAKR